MDEVLISVISKDLHGIRQGITELAKDSSEMKSTLASADALNGSAKTMIGKLDAAERMVDKCSGEAMHLRKEVLQLREQLAKPIAHQHHHHFPKIIWITFALLVGFSIAVGGWVQSSQAENSYRDADTKYRLLRLLPGELLGIRLRKVDSLVKSDPAGIRDSVELVEQARARYWRTMEEAEQLRRRGFGR